MSGHSKWSTIKRKKGAIDAARSKVFQKLAKELYVAAKSGDPDPANNASLRMVVEKAKAENMPKVNIESAIQKAASKGSGENYEFVRYEGYGPSGVALMIDCLTDNKNRTAGFVRSTLSKKNGNLGTDGSVSYMFKTGFIREKYIEAEGLAKHFKVFAHADFYCDETAAVIECKYSQDETMKVYEDYLPQLQWYYMLGASKVTLYHGWGNVLPFEVVGEMPVTVCKDNDYIYWLRHGIAVLDQAIEDGVFDDYDTTEVTVSEMDEETAAACRALGVVIARMKEAEKLADEHKATLLAWMEAHGVLNIKGEGFTVSYVSPTTRKTFDTKKAQADFPDLKDDKYYKTSSVKSSVKITLKP